jgi:intraflagellar transport protein 74
LTERDTVVKQRGQLRQQIYTTQQTIESIQKGLNDKETFSQLNALQSRLSHLASTHFQLKREVNQKTVESDVAGVISEVQSLADSYNSLLMRLSSVPTLTKRYTNM